MAKTRLSFLKVLFSFLLLSTPVIAQEDIKVCHQFGSTVARLGCYDKASGFGASQPAGAEKTDDQGTSVDPEVPAKPSHTPNKWRIRTVISDIDDSTNVFLSVTSKEVVRSRFGRSDYLTLFIQCRENTTLTYVHFAGNFMSDYQHGTVTYRLDKTPAQRIRMKESNDHEALGLWGGSKAIPFVKGMFGYDNLLVKATPHSENAVSAVFPIAGLEEAIKPLREACHW